MFTHHAAVSGPCLCPAGGAHAVAVPWVISACCRWFSPPACAAALVVVCACRYAALLEATMEHCPHVCSIPPAELMAFCSDSGYRCRLELEGSLLMPPEYNVHVTDWERSLRLRCAGSRSRLSCFVVRRPDMQLCVRSNLTGEVCYSCCWDSRWLL